MACQHQPAAVLVVHEPFTALVGADAIGHEGQCAEKHNGTHHDRSPE